MSGGTVNVDSLSLILAVLDTSNTNDFFGQIGSSGPGTPGNFGGLMFNQVTSGNGQNGGTVIAQISALGHINASPPNTSGPFKSALPDRNDPNQLSILSVSCTGAGQTTVVLQPNQASIKQYNFATFTADISGVSPAGFDGAFTITPSDDVTFTYTAGATCPAASGTGASMKVQDEDPAIGDNVGIWLSLVPELP